MKLWWNLELRCYDCIPGDENPTECYGKEKVKQYGTIETQQNNGVYGCCYCTGSENDITGASKIFGKGVSRPFNLSHKVRSKSLRNFRKKKNHCFFKAKTLKTLKTQKKSKTLKHNQFIIVLALLIDHQKIDRSSIF